ncbi:MAG: hypothetical protein ACHQQP_08675 [Gemmatimonadales bacterium]
MRSALVFAALFLGACAGTMKPPTEAPRPVAARPAEPRSSLPPLSLPPDSSDVTPGSAAVPAAELPVTVLPTIVGHRASMPGVNAQPVGGVTRADNDQTVRIALALGQRSPRISATGGWTIYDGATDRLLGRLGANDNISAESRDGMLLVKGNATQSIRGPLIARPDDPATSSSFDGHR